MFVASAFVNRWLDNQTGKWNLIEWEKRDTIREVTVTAAKSEIHRAIDEKRSGEKQSTSDKQKLALADALEQVKNVKRSWRNGVMVAQLIANQSNRNVV